MGISCLGCISIGNQTNLLTQTCTCGGLIMAVESSFGSVYVNGDNQTTKGFSQSLVYLS